MKRIVFLIITMTALILCALWLYLNPVQKPAKRKSEETIIKGNVKIGVLLPDGEMTAEQKTQNLCAIDMAVNELNRESYRQHYGTAVRYAAWDQSEIKRQTNELIGWEKADVIFSLMGGNVIAEMTEAESLPHITTFADETVGAESKNTFTNWVMPKEYAEAVTAFLKNKNVKTLAVFKYTHPIANKLVQEIANHAEAKGIEIVSNEEFKMGGNSTSEMMRRIETEKNPDMYLIMGVLYETDVLAEYAKTEGIQSKFIAVETLEKFKDHGGFEGSFFAVPGKGTADFAEKIKNACGIESTTETSYIYDSIKLIGYAFENGYGKKDFADVLKNKKLTSSKELHIDENKVVRSKPVIKQISGGRIIEIKEQGNVQ